MKYIWLVIFPLLYLPETLFQGTTNFGTLTVSDVGMLLYIPAVLVAILARVALVQYRPTE